ncbi:MAG: four helix bundle protein [Elusimicrobiota bacterium]
MLQSYKELYVWQKAYQLTLIVYKLTEKFPKNEQYGLTLQVRRCAVSIVSNIAEGYQRQHNWRIYPVFIYSIGFLCRIGNPIIVSKRFKIYFS